jgi:hypothetical protein
MHNRLLFDQGGELQNKTLYQLYQLENLTLKYFSIKSNNKHPTAPYLTTRT